MGGGPRVPAVAEELARCARVGLLALREVAQQLLACASRKRPKTAVFGVFLMPPAGGENLLPFYYWLPLKFRFLAQQPPNKV